MTLKKPRISFLIIMTSGISQINWGFNKRENNALGWWLMYRLCVSGWLCDRYLLLFFSQTGTIWDSPKVHHVPGPLDARLGSRHRCLQTETQEHWPALQAWNRLDVLLNLDLSSSDCGACVVGYESNVVRCTAVVGESCLELAMVAVVFHYVVSALQWKCLSNGIWARQRSTFFRPRTRLLFTSYHKVSFRLQRRRFGFKFGYYLSSLSGEQSAQRSLKGALDSIFCHFLWVVP